MLPAIDWVFVFPVNQLKGFVAFIKHELGDNNNSAEDDMVLTSVVSKDVSKSSPSLETSVDRLMPGSCNTHCFQMQPVFGLVRGATLDISTIAFVTDNLFSG